MIPGTAVWYLVWVCGRVGVSCGGISDAMGSKNRCDNFSTEAFDWQMQSKKVNFFGWIPQSTKTQSEKVESKKPFFDCVRKPDLGFSRKRSFSTDKSDCVRNVLIKYMDILEKIRLATCLNGSTGA